MKGQKIGTMMMGLLLGTMAAAGGAAAQGFGDGDFADDGIFGGELFEDVVQGDIEAPDMDRMVVECDGDETLNHIADVDAHRDLQETRDQEVSIDEDDVLLGIALANNGASDVSFENLRDFTVTETDTATVTQDADLDRDDVFSALALGLDADAGALDALDCASDVSSTVTQTTTATQAVDLDEDEVLLAIGLANSVGDDIQLSDVASINTDAQTTLDKTQTVDVDREDVFLSLALGAGGSEAAATG